MAGSRRTNDGRSPAIAMRAASPWRPARSTSAERRPFRLPARDDFFRALDVRVALVDADLHRQGLTAGLLLRRDLDLRDNLLGAEAPHDLRRTHETDIDLGR